MYIHPSSIVDPGATIGEGTKIWHFCHIMPQAIIGNNCNIGQNVFVADGVVIGNNVKIQNNVSLYGGVNIQDDVFLGPSCVFTNVINPRSGVDRKSEYRQTILQKGTTIGANATIICGITLGQYAFVGAGTVVTKSFPDYALIIGNPGQQTGWMSEAGAKLVFDYNDEAICEISGQKYRLYQNEVQKC